MGEGEGLTCPTVHGECCEYTVPVSGISILELHSCSPEDYISGSPVSVQGSKDTRCSKDVEAHNQKFCNDKIMWCGITAVGGGQ